MRRPALKYRPGKSWKQTLGLKNFKGDSWTSMLEHIAEQTGRCLRSYGLDPDLGPVRGDQQHLLIPYQRPLIRECWEAYTLARDCLEAPRQSLTGYQLFQIWESRDLAAVAGPSLLAQLRKLRDDDRGRKRANQNRKDEADSALLAQYASWDMRMRHVLGDASIAERVRKFIATGQIRADRKKRRIRALLKANRIPLAAKN